MPKAEANKIKAACQVWYDTVLALKDFQGGIIVAKNGNIVFENITAQRILAVLMLLPIQPVCT
ncbi:MAG: hypothetical protein IPP48_11855 [Chitinophagaceae bacterium]|nr:hypothetical protein [Chitinophagaceae bacterium]